MFSRRWCILKIGARRIGRERVASLQIASSVPNCCLNMVRTTFSSSRIF